MGILRERKKETSNRAIYETRDRQLIPLDDIQHINARYNDAMKDDNTLQGWHESDYSCE